MEKIIKALNEFSPDSLNGAVIIHMDKKTKEIKSISPLLSASSIDELYNQLSDTRDAIQHFLNDLVNKGLHKNGQSN